MISFQRLHEEPSIPSFLEGYDQDRWRLTHSQAYATLAFKSCLPPLTSHKPGPSALLLATNASYLARILCEKLNLDVAFTECLILARLLGYPAGGEFSARVLSRLMQKHGGFTLTEQALRTIEELEMIFPEFNGINASWEIRHALGAVPSQFLRTYRELSPDKPEHGVAAFATRITLLELDLLQLPMPLRLNALRNCSLWNNIQSSITASYPQLEAMRFFTFTLHRFLLRLVDEASLITGHLAVTLSPDSDRSLQDLEHSLHGERKLSQPNFTGGLELENAFTNLFHFLIAHPTTIPERFALRIKKDGVHRVVCDLLSSLGNEQIATLNQQYNPSTAPTPKREQLDLL